ncbi:MAG: glycosyltransferase family 39 protein [Candidatus Korobacteraceae bacterium]
MYLPIIVAVLSVVTATLLIVAVYPVYCQTFDEALHVAAGMEWIQLGRSTFNPITPPLVPIAVALGPYIDGSRLQGNSDPWVEGNAVLESEGHYQRTLILARLGTLPFFLLACFLLWHSSQSYGLWQAALAVVFFAFCPLVLAHASLATVDMAFTALFLSALLGFWHFLQSPKLSAAVLAGAMVGFAILSKLSALPYLVVCCVALYASEWHASRTRITLKHIITGVLTCAFIIWAGYRFSIGPIYEVGHLTPVQSAYYEKLPGLLQRAAVFGGVPAPELFRGAARAFVLGAGKGALSYLFGESYTGGRWYFFPVAIAVKTPIPLLVFAVVGVARALVRRKVRNMVLPLVGIAGPLLVAMLSKTNLGLRYILVIYPFLAMMAAYAVAWLWHVGGAGTKRFTYRSATLILIVWNIVSCVRATPDFIPYFNEVAAPYGSSILIDSDFDWGQDLNRLSTVLQQQHIRSISIAYEGSADLKLLDVPVIRRLTPNDRPGGWMAVSEFLIRVFPEKYGWVDKYKPERIVGKTIRLYHFDMPPSG